MPFTPSHLQLTSIKPSLAVPYPYHPQDGSDLWPRDNALQRFGALLPSRGPRTHSHRAGAAGGVRALRSRPGVGGLEDAWGGWFWDGFEMVLIWFLECFDPDGRWEEFHLESWGRTIFEPMSLRSKRQPTTFNVGMGQAYRKLCKTLVKPPGLMQTQMLGDLCQCFVLLYHLDHAGCTMTKNTITKSYLCYELWWPDT